MNEDSALVEHFVLGVDIENYSERVARHQGLVQDRLRTMLDEAAREAGLDRAGWRQKQPGGDGEMAALPPGSDLRCIVGPFVRLLDDRLHLHNEDYSPKLEMRLRLAMHCDVFTPSVFGTAGPAFVEVRRLLDAQPLKDALRNHGQAALALLVSHEVFRKVVHSDLAELRAKDFTEVQVSHPAKGYERAAHLYVPRHRPPSAPDGGRHATAPPSPSAGPFQPPAAGSPPTVRIGGDGNKHNVLGNQAGRDLHIRVEEAAKADPFDTGMTAFRDQNYPEAARHLREAAASDTHGQGRADLRFRLALALLGGCRPQLHRRPGIQRIERELEKALSLEPEHYGALLLSAIIKQDYYMRNGFDYTGPSPDQLLAVADRGTAGQETHRLAAEIVEHVPAQGNAIWSSLCELTRSGTEEHA